MAKSSPNSRNKRPAVPGKKAIGINTATSTAVVAMTAKKTRRVPITAATLDGSPAARRRCTLSSTTMASSTISPVASTSAKRVRMLMEKPRSQQAAIVPSNEMGIAMAGINVSRIEPEKSLMVAITTSTAMPSVNSTSFTAPRIKTALSEMIDSVSSPESALILSIAVLTPSEISMVLEPACLTIPMPTTRSPFKRTMLLASAGEKVTRATSLTRIPSRMTKDSISCSWVTAASARTRSCCSPALKLPAGTSSGAPRSTLATSVTVSP